MCGATPRRPRPVRIVRRRSCTVQRGNCVPAAAIRASSFRLAADQPVKPCRGLPNTHGPSWRITERKICSAGSGNVSVSVRRFFVRLAASVSTPVSKSISSHRSAPISSRRHPVMVSNLTILPKSSSVQASNIAFSSPSLSSAHAASPQLRGCWWRRPDWIHIILHPWPRRTKPKGCSALWPMPSDRAPW